MVAEKKFKKYILKTLALNQNPFTKLYIKELCQSYLFYIVVRTSFALDLKNSLSNIFL